MIPIKFLIIFRELSITQCLRSHRHRQHLWHILMSHPYTLSLLPLESQSAEPLPERKYGAGRGWRRWVRPGRKLAGSEIWDDSAYGMEKGPRGVEVRGESSTSDEITFPQSPELTQEYRGGRERRHCIPRANHHIANNGVELRAR